MAKRFTETTKWGDPWYRKLPCEYRDLWQYILDNCDNAGVWIKDFELAQFCVGTQLEEEKALSLINNGKERIKILNTGSRWLIVDFVSFQFGELSKKSRVHLSIMALQAKHQKKGYQYPINRVKDKEKDKEKDKNKDIITQLRENPAYKHINIENELAKMDAWLLVHKGRQKTQRFVVNWLNKIDRPIETPKETLKPADPKCPRCRGDGKIYAPGSGKTAICSCRR